VGSLLGAGPIVSLIDSTLADDGRDVFVAPVDLDEPAVFELSKADNYEQIRPEYLARAPAGESPPAVGFGLDFQ